MIIKIKKAYLFNNTRTRRLEHLSMILEITILTNYTTLFKKINNYSIYCKLQAKVYILGIKDNN